MQDVDLFVCTIGQTTLTNIVTTTQVTLGETWVEEDTGGLFYSKVDVLNMSGISDRDEDEHEEGPVRVRIRRDGDCSIM